MCAHVVGYGDLRGILDLMRSQLSQRAGHVYLTRDESLHQSFYDKSDLLPNVLFLGKCTSFSFLQINGTVNTNLRASSQPQPRCPDLSPVLVALEAE